MVVRGDATRSGAIARRRHLADNRSEMTPAGLPPLDPPTGCEHLAGVFFVRRCGAPAVAHCQRCARAACGDHLRAEEPVGGYTCLDCLRRPQAVGATSTIFADASPSSGADPADAPSQSGSGEFGGAGASGGWDAADPAATSDAFSAADYAAFDAMTQSDRHGGGSGYDS